MSFRVLCCGDRNWTDRDAIRLTLRRLLAEHPDLEICEGEARGADMIAREEAEKLGIQVTRFPADWKRYGRAAGPIRNMQMLREFQPDEVFAFHANLAKSKGTKHMVKIACDAGGIAVEVVMDCSRL